MLQVTQGYVTPVGNSLVGGNPTDVVLGTSLDPWRIRFDPILGEIAIPGNSYALISVFMSPSVPTSIITNYYGGPVSVYHNSQTWGGPTTNMTLVVQTTSASTAYVYLTTSSGGDASWTVFASNAVHDTL
jgi:hypothetical protein